MSQYKYKGDDLDDIYEPVNIGTEYVANNGTPYSYIGMNQYASYTTDYLFYEKPNVGYKSNSIDIPCVALGKRPRPTLRYTFSSPGTYYITRDISNNLIKIWNSSGSLLSSFNVTGSNGKIFAPKILLVHVIGHGGNGGGTDGAQGRDGGGGGGGGKFIGYCEIKETSVWSQGTKFIVGSYGTNSSVQYNNVSMIAGPGGTGGKGVSDSGGVGGSGGVCSITEPNNINIGILILQNGGNGGSAGHTGGSSNSITELIKPENYNTTIPYGSGGYAREGGSGGGSEGNGGAGGGTGSNGYGGIFPGGGGGGAGGHIWDANSGGSGANGTIRIYY